MLPHALLVSGELVVGFWKFSKYLALLALMLSFAVHVVAIGEDESPVTVSLSGDARRNVIVWMDHRAVEQAERINTLHSPVLQFVGGAVSPEMQPPKVLCMTYSFIQDFQSFHILIGVCDVSKAPMGERESSGILGSGIPMDGSE